MNLTTFLLLFKRKWTFTERVVFGTILSFERYQNIFETKKSGSLFSIGVTGNQSSMADEARSLVYYIQGTIKLLGKPIKNEIVLSLFFLMKFLEGDSFGSEL